MLRWIERNHRRVGLSGKSLDLMAMLEWKQLSQGGAARRRQSRIARQPGATCPGGADPGSAAQGHSDQGAGFPQGHPCLGRIFEVVAALDRTYKVCDRGMRRRWIHGASSNAV